MSEFKIKFRGVRGSYPVVNRDFMNYGGNTSCVEILAGENLLILDAGTGIISLGNELLKQHIASADDLFERIPVNAAILLSHLHSDHIQGLNFFKPLNILTDRKSVV